MKRSKRPKAKKGAWFVRLRGSYFPVRHQGWVLYGVYVVYLIAAIAYVHLRAIDYLDYAITLPILFIAGFATMTWIAERNS